MAALMNSHRIIPNGLGGTSITVSEANRLAVEGSRSPDIITLARDIMLGGNVPERDKYAEVLAIHNWVKNNSRYTNDSVDAEVLTSIKGPQGLMAMYKTHGQFAGDCDDFVIFEAALLRSVGIPTRFVTISRAERDPMNRMQHIYLEANVDGGWMPLDPILKNRPAGYAAPMYTAKKVFDLEGVGMYPNSRIPKTRRGGRRGPSSYRGGSVSGLGSLVEWAKESLVRSGGTDAEKAAQREKNRIENAKAIFAKAAAGEAVPLTGTDSIAYATDIYKRNGLTVPKLPFPVSKSAIPSMGVGVPGAPSGKMSTGMIIGLAVGGIVLAKVLKLF